MLSESDQSHWLSRIMNALLLRNGGGSVRIVTMDTSLAERNIIHQNPESNHQETSPGLLINGSSRASPSQLSVTKSVINGHGLTNGIGFINGLGLTRGKSGGDSLMKADALPIKATSLKNDRIDKIQPGLYMDTALINGFAIVGGRIDAPPTKGLGWKGRRRKKAALETLKRKSMIPICDVGSQRRGLSDTIRTK